VGILLPVGELWTVVVVNSFVNLLVEVIEGVAEYIAEVLLKLLKV